MLGFIIESFSLGFIERTNDASYPEFLFGYVANVLEPTNLSFTSNLGFVGDFFYSLYLILKEAECIKDMID